MVGKGYVRTPHLADDGTLVELLATAAPARGVPGGRRRHRGLDLPPASARELLRGPIKLVVADHALPDLDTLAPGDRARHAQGRTVACHCASDTALVLAVAAWQHAGAGPGDRVEHGSVAPGA